MINIYLSINDLNDNIIKKFKSYGNINIHIINYQYSKDEIIDMLNGIQIDTELDNMRDTNPNVKIVIRDYSRDWYSTPLINQDNVYVVKDWNDALDVLNFLIENPIFIQRCY